MGQHGQGQISAEFTECTPGVAARRGDGLTSLALEIAGTLTASRAVTLLDSRPTVSVIALKVSALTAALVINESTASIQICYSTKWGRVVSARLSRSPVSSDCAFVRVGRSVSSRYTFPRSGGLARRDLQIDCITTDIFSQQKGGECKCQQGTYF